MCGVLIGFVACAIVSVNSHNRSKELGIEEAVHEINYLLEEGGYALRISYTHSGLNLRIPQFGSVAVSKPQP
jgi:hypothetical protein